MIKSPTHSQICHSEAAHGVAVQAQIPLELAEAEAVVVLAAEGVEVAFKGIMALRMLS